MNDKIQEIRKALEEDVWMAKEDADMIRYLLTELDVAKAEAEQQRQIRYNATEANTNNLHKAAEEIERLKQENERLQIQAGINVDLGSALSMLQEEIEKLRAVNSNVSKLNGEYKEEIVVLRDHQVQLHDDNFKLKEEIERLIWINEGLSDAELKAGDFKEKLHKAIHALEWYSANGSQFTFLYEYGQTARETLSLIREGEQK